MMRLLIARCSITAYYNRSPDPRDSPPNTGDMCYEYVQGSGPGSSLSRRGGMTLASDRTLVLSRIHLSPTYLVHLLDLGRHRRRAVCMHCPHSRPALQRHPGPTC